MKTRFLWGLFITLSVVSASAQNQKNIYAEASKALEQNFKFMLENAHPNINIKKNDKLSCEALPVLEQFTKADLVPKTKPFETYFKMILEDYGKKLNNLTDNIIKDTSSDPNLSYFAAVNRSKRFKDFAEDITGKNISDINKKDKEILIDFYLNHPLKKGQSVTAKGQKVATAKFAPCYATTEHELKPISWKYPGVNWTIKTRVTITCDCEADSDPMELNEAIFVYDANIRGSMTKTKIEFGRTRAASYDLEYVSCCDENERPEEQDDPDRDHEEPLEEPKGSSTVPASLPQQTIGVSGGIGLAQDFEEVAICLGAEYLYNVTDLGDSSLFVGANAQFSNTSFMDFSSTWIQVGPTAQLFCPINPSQDLHWTNGIDAGYIFGTNDNNGFKDDISGFAISLNTGLNIQVKDNLAISLIVPVVTHQNITREAQDGSGSLEVSDTSILLNKANPLKVGLRFGF